MLVSFCVEGNSLHTWSDMGQPYIESATHPITMRHVVDIMRAIQKTNFSTTNYAVKLIIQIMLFCAT